MTGNERPFLLQHLLARAAAVRPEHLAVDDGATSLTYGALDELSDRMAATLQRIALKAGDRVAVLIPRGAWALVAFYGALKARCCYVPLDPDAPDARLRKVLEDSGSVCLLATPPFGQRAQALRGLVPSLRHVVELGADGVAALSASVAFWSQLQDQSALSSAAQGTECDLAYILYTSGSTGAPKGVAITHRAALSFVEWAVATLGLTPEDRLINTASLQFDLSVFDIFAAAYVGATVLPVPKEIMMFPSPFARWLESSEGTCLYAVPSLLTRLIERGNLAERSLRLRLVLFAGEVFPPRHLPRLLEALPRAQLYNLYGPTETNVITYHRVEPGDVDGQSPIPLGRACSNCDIVLRDEQGATISQPGVEGEIVASGPTVASRYWGEPLSDGRRLRSSECPPSYRTGDYAVWDERGRLVFRGRRDHMVKSGGYRIELGEVEAALHAHAGVTAAAVVAVADDAFGTRLVAFVQATSEVRESLREHCAALLPAYMRPTAIHVIEGLPRGITGKVDRAALLQRCQGD